MKKFRLVSFITILSVLLSFSSFAHSEEIAESDEGMTATIKEAQLVANKFLTKYNLKVQSEKLESVKEVFGINDELVGYYVKFSKSYVLVSANKNYSPVLIAGKGDLPFSKINETGKIYYIGGTFGIKARSSDEIIGTFDQYSKQKITKDKLKLNKNPSSKKAWNSYLDTGSDSDFSTFAIIEKKLTMTTFNQWDSNVASSYRSSACGPTTMAAISEYWRTTKGKSSIKGLDYYMSKGHMINHFYNEHGGTAIGMSVNAVKEGLVGHTDGFYSTAAASTISGFSSYKNEIANSRPVAIKFDSYFTFFEPDYDYAYNYHWVVGKGYVYDSIDNIIIINNNISSTESGQEQYIDFPSNEPILSLVKFTV